MRFYAKQLLGMAALIALALPVWGRTATVWFESDGTTTIGQTQLKAGEYQLKVKDNATQLEVTTQDGKVVTEVPVTWIQLQKKPANTEVIMNKDRVVEVDFGGKTQALKVQSAGTAKAQ